MSAFVVGDDVMTHAVRVMVCKSRDGFYNGLVRFTDELINDSKSIDRIGQRLFAMNVDAVTQRYPDLKANPANMPGPCDAKGKSKAGWLAKHWKYDGDFSPMNLTEMLVGYKAVSCILYQCGEGTVPDSALYQELDAFLSSLARAIVNTLPGYEALPWG